MSHSAHPDCEQNSTSTLPEQPGVLVVRKHHFLVRCSHWLNVPILLGLILSGISIYWASPIYQHKPDPSTGNFDVAADIGVWICAHMPGQHHYSSPPAWIYNHMSLGPVYVSPHSMYRPVQPKPSLACLLLPSSKSKPMASECFIGLPAILQRP